MVFILSALTSIILATPILRHEPMTQPLPTLPIVEVSIAEDNLTGNRTLVLNTYGILGPVVYDQISLFEEGELTLQLKNLTGIQVISTETRVLFNITLMASGHNYIYEANISANYTTSGPSAVLVIEEYPHMPSYKRRVTLTMDELPYKQEALEVDL